MYRNQIILSVLVAAVVLLPSSASAGDYRELCMSALSNVLMCCFSNSSVEVCVHGGGCGVTL